MPELKLKEKQLAALNSIQLQKKQLSDAYAILNEKENMMLEIIFEAGGIVGQISNVKLEQEKLIFDLEEQKKVKPKKE